MRRNRSVVRRQIPFSAPTRGVCLLPPYSPMFQSSVTSSAPHAVFFLTAFPHSDILNRIRCDHDEVVGSAHSKGGRWRPASFQQSRWSELTPASCCRVGCPLARDCGGVDGGASA